MRIAEGEDEHIHMCFVGVAAVPRKRRIATKEIVLVRADDSDCRAFVVAMLVEG